MAQQSRNLRKRENSGGYYNNPYDEEEKPQKKLDDWVKEDDKE